MGQRGRAELGFPVSALSILREQNFAVPFHSAIANPPVVLWLNRLGNFFCELRPVRIDPPIRKQYITSRGMREHISKLKTADILVLLAYFQIGRDQSSLRRFCAQVTGATFVDFAIGCPQFMIRHFCPVLRPSHDLFD